MEALIDSNLNYDSFISSKVCVGQTHTYSVFYIEIIPSKIASHVLYLVIPNWLKDQATKQNTKKMQNTFTLLVTQFVSSWDVKTFAFHPSNLLKTKTGIWETH